MAEKEDKIDARGASDYFATRTTRFSQWARYGVAQKSAAIIEAVELFTRAFRAPPDPANQKDCECVYEQALYMLTRFSEPTVPSNSRPALNGPEMDGETQAAIESSSGPWSLRALSKQGRVEAKLKVVPG